MLVTFVGAPLTGKSTTAALLYSRLKLMGRPTEIVQEYAREYIALRHKAGDNRPLTDEDQVKIMTKQFEKELLFFGSMKANPLGLVISEGSSVNAMLYMSKNLWSNPDIVSKAKALLSASELVFWAAPIDLPEYVQAMDPNRVHTLEQSRDVATRVQDLFQHLDFHRAIVLQGGAEKRASKALTAVLNYSATRPNNEEQQQQPA